MKRLHEVGLLGHVYAISATSGGAITAAILATHRDHIDENINALTYKWDEFERLTLKIATSGQLGRTTLLVSAITIYATALFATVVSLIALPMPRILIFGLASVGLLLHLILIGRLILDKAYCQYPAEQAWAKFITEEKLNAVTGRSIGRFIRMIFMPSLLRLETLNAKSFRGQMMRSLPITPMLFLNAVNLNDGQQKILWKGGIADLDITGSRKLWRGSEYDKHQDFGIAEAVAASSAIPLFFRPVTIKNDHGMHGVFVDGGVADNLAINIPKALASFISPAARYYDGSFAEYTSLMLIVDGSMPLAEKPRKTSWTRIFSLKRVSDAMMNQQVSDVSINTFAFKKLGVTTWVLSLREGMPFNVREMVAEYKDVLQKFRTHLDAFTLQECAVLAYCGYALVETLLKDEMPDLLGRYPGTKYPEFRKFDEILPTETGSWDTSPTSIQTTLRYANRRFALLRWLGRTFGI